MLQDWLKYAAEFDGLIPNPVKNLYVFHFGSWNNGERNKGAESGVSNIIFWYETGCCWLIFVTNV